MRHALPLAVALAPLALSPALAERFALTSKVAEAEFYASGANLTRRIALDLPAGQHELVVTDLPANIPLSALRIAAEGVRLGAVSLRENNAPPEPADSAELTELRAALEALEAEAQTLADEMAPLQASARAAEAELKALEGVTLSAVLPQEARPLSEITADLRRGMEAALAVRLAARQALRPLKAEAAELDEKIDAARRALEAAEPPAIKRASLVIAAHAAEAISTDLEITYLTQDAAWQPVYDLRLERASGIVRLERGADLRQVTGEPWEDVAITLSTAMPSGQMGASLLTPWLRMIVPSQESDGVMMTRAAPEMSADGSFIAGAPAQKMLMEGIMAQYRVAEGTDLASGSEGARVSLGEIEMPGDVFARAVPEYDETAYLAARLRNATGEPLLPAPARLFVDGAFVGQHQLDGVSGGGEIEVSFGPIEGLRLTQETRGQVGEEGLLTSRNAREDLVIYTIENQTGAAWDLRLLARVPYSEQERLNIIWEANPQPEQRDVGGQQGVHEWHLAVPAQETRRIQLDVELRWPDDYVLR